jgi:type I restriction enzyme S subunit
MQANEAAQRNRTQIEAQDVPSGYKRTEIGVMPQDWQPWPVRRMGEVITGKALAISAPGQQRPYLRTKNVFDGRIEIDDVLTMPMTDAEFEHFHLLPGDVLLNEGQSLELVGRCAIYRNEYPKPCAMQNQLLRFRARPGVSAEFAAHLFRYSQQAGVFARIALQTTSIAHLGATRFEQLQLSWPERESEQRAIAEVLSDVDRLLGALEAQIAKKRAIKQAAIQQLLTGKTRLPGFGRSWDRRRIDSITKIPVTDGPHLTPKFLPEGVPFLSVNNLAHNRVDPTDLRYISFADHREFSKKCKPQKWDVLLGKAASVGKVAIVDFEWEFNIWSPIALIRPGDSANPHFVYYSLQSAYAIKQIEYFTNASSQGNIGMADIGKLELLLPSRDEQEAIATVLSDIDSEISALGAHRDKTRAIKQGMMQQLLTGRVRLEKPSSEVAGE